MLPSGCYVIAIRKHWTSLLTLLDFWLCPPFKPLFPFSPQPYPSYKLEKTKIKNKQLIYPPFQKGGLTFFQKFHSMPTFLKLQNCCDRINWWLYIRYFMYLSMYRLKAFDSNYLQIPKNEKYFRRLSEMAELSVQDRYSLFVSPSVQLLLRCLTFSIFYFNLQDIHTGEILKTKSEITALQVKKKLFFRFGASLLRNASLTYTFCWPVRRSRTLEVWFASVPRKDYLYIIFSIYI